MARRQHNGKRWTPERILALVGSLLALLGLSGGAMTWRDAARVEPLVDAMVIVTSEYDRKLRECRATRTDCGADSTDGAD